MIRYSSMEGNESLLEAIYEEDEQTLEEGQLEPELEDAEMLDAETVDGEDDDQIPSADSTQGLDAAAAGKIESGSNGRRKGKKNRKRRNKKNNNNRLDSNSIIADINRFVVDTCRQLKERKPYLVWNAVGVLGASAVRDLVKEVGAIQRIGGQLTADGKRSRTGGGVLWNILKTREPKAYKEIMARGKEFEKQFRSQTVKQPTKCNTVDSSLAAAHTSHGSAGQVLGSSQTLLEANLEPDGGHVSALKRIRAPVSYDDLFGDYT